MKKLLLILFRQFFTEHWNIYREEALVTVNAYHPSLNPKTATRKTKIAVQYLPICWNTAELLLYTFWNFELLNYETRFLGIISQEKVRKNYA